KWLEAETERKKVAAAEKKARDERDESRRLTVGMLLDKGIDRAERGGVAEGVFWMLEALQAAPEDDHGLRRAARLNVAAWLPLAQGLRQVVPGNFRCVAVAPDGRFVTGNRTGEVQVWDAAGEPLGPSVKLPADFVNAVAFSPDGKQVVVCARTLAHR